MNIKKRSGESVPYDVDKIHNFVSSLEPKPINSLPDNPLNHLLVASFSAALLVVLFKLNFK